MILVYPVETMPKVIRKTYDLEPDVFLKLRDFYELNKDICMERITLSQTGMTASSCRIHTTVWIIGSTSRRNEKEARTGTQTMTSLWERVLCDSWKNGL